MGIENGKIKPLAPADSSGSEEINKSDPFILTPLFSPLFYSLFYSLFYLIL